MKNKIFLGLVALAAVVTGTLCYYAYSWLGSIGDPLIASQGYVSNSTNSWTVLWISFVVLFATGLLSIWATRARWPLWISFGYFALFSLLLMLNDSAYSTFLEKNSLDSEYTLLNPLIIAVLLVVLLIAVLAAQMLTLKVRVKVKKEDRSDNDETSETTAKEAD